MGSEMCIRDSRDGTHARATRRDGTHVNLEVFVQVVRQDQVVRHGEPVRFHRVVVPVVRRPDVRVVEVRDAILRGRHRGGAKTRPPSPPSRSPRAADNARGFFQLRRRAHARKTFFDRRSGALCLFFGRRRTARVVERKGDETTNRRASSADVFACRHRSSRERRVSSRGESVDVRRVRRVSIHQTSHQ